MDYLQPWKDKKQVRGRLTYNESTQAWSLMRLHKLIIEEFGELKEKRGEFFYEMVLFYSYEQFERFMKKTKRDGKIPPMLFWIGKKE